MLKCQVETLDVLLADGLEDMIWDHWEETETDREEIPLSVDWDYYRGMQRAGGYLVVSGRLDGALVGYNGFFLNRLPKYRHTMIAINDVLYLTPEARRGWNGVRLIRETHKVLSGAGAKRIIYGINDAARVGRRGATLGDLLTCLGYGKRGEVFSRLV